MMIELALTLQLLVPGRPTALGDWLTYARYSNSCARYARVKGYKRYLWMPELGHNDKGIHLTGQCYGIKKNRGK